MEHDRHSGAQASTALTDQHRELIESAKRTADRLYLDGIHEVAAALRTTSGELFIGIHIEASVGYADVCGEVAAMCNMVSAGRRDLEVIVAVASNGRGSYELLAPCGRCRELISDFNPNASVIVGTLERPYLISVADLLPLKLPR
jgi:cytidine deaminase